MDDEPEGVAATIATTIGRLGLDDDEYTTGGESSIEGGGMVSKRMNLLESGNGSISPIAEDASVAPSFIEINSTGGPASVVFDEPSVCTSGNDSIEVTGPFRPSTNYAV